MALIGTHNLQVLRGLTGNLSLLSCSGDGTVVDLWNQDDNSGRQDWNVSLVPSYTDRYHITVSNGVSGDRRYLSCAADGSKIDLWDEDDNTGRQQWKFLEVPGGICSYYNIVASGGVSGGLIYLSCTEDGRVVDLWTQDDGSGRQRWQVQ